MDDSLAMQCYRGLQVGWQFKFCACAHTAQPDGLVPVLTSNFAHTHDILSVVQSPRDTKCWEHMLASCVVAPYAQSWCDRDFSVSSSISSSVYRYITLFERTGNVKPKSYRHWPPKLLGAMEQLFLLRVILTYPGIYLSENLFPNLAYPWT